MTPPYPVTHPAFWRAYLVTTRPYLCFLSGVTGLVGLVLPAAPPGRAALLGVAFGVFFATYGFGQALTDVFQIDTDSLSSPYRPLTRGLVARRDVAAVSVAGLLGCGLALALLSWWTLPLSALGVLGLATYTPFKRRWWSGPLYNGWIVALLPLLGATVAGLEPSAALAEPKVTLAMLSAFASYAVFVLLGYHKDVSADRASGYTTLPVRFGWRASVAVSAGFAATAGLASAALLGLAGLPATGGLTAAAAVALAALGLGSLAYAHRVMLADERESEAHHAISHVVRGYVLLHLGEACAFAPRLVGPALLYAALFEVALALRPERTQI